MNQFQQLNNSEEHWRELIVNVYQHVMYHMMLAFYIMDMTIVNVVHSFEEMVEDQNMLNVNNERTLLV